MKKQMKNILRDLTFEIQRLNSNLEYLRVDKPMPSQKPVPNRILKRMLADLKNNKITPK